MKCSLINSNKMKKSAFLLLSILLATQVFAQDAFTRFQFGPNLNYDSNIPSPAEYLGYELGEEYTPHYEVMAYIKLLATLSDRITFHEYAKTYERRSVNYAVITSSQNQNNIEAIREANLELANNAVNVTISDQPIVVWMSYNVHGNEPSSSESAMQAIYRFVAANDTETRNWLDNSVIIIDPMMNPDGRDRYVTWYKSVQANILNTDEFDLEHDEIWPGGRTNHYWFDLNRDWIWGVHPESRGRIAVYQNWMPQVHMDFHEQGFNNNYFVMPGQTPFNLELPDDYQKWADVFGRGAVAEFDKALVNYASREAFDFFYPSYGSSYPSVMGGIGMLAEQGGHSRGGRAVSTDDDYVLTLRQRVFDHYKNSTSIVKTSVENRVDLLNYFKSSMTPSSSKERTKAYYLPNNENDYTYDVINILLRHNVELEQAEQDFTVRDAYSYWDGKSSSRQFKKGDFIIKTDQARHIFINTLMKRQLEINDSVMYDMATWSVPHAYNLDAAWSISSPRVKTSRVESPLSSTSGLNSTENAYAYVIDWKQRNAPKALSKIWDMGYKVRSAEKPFVFKGKTYSEGSLIVLVGRNYEMQNNMPTDFEKIAAYAGVQIDALNTGRMDSGIDLGSAFAQPLHQPKVALMVDSPFSSYTAGQIWFLFDQWTEFGISRIRTNTLGRVNLSDYDVIIMPSGGGLSSAFGENEKSLLQSWVRNGGTLVGAEAAAMWLTKDQSGITNAEIFEVEEDKDESKEINPEAYSAYVDRGDISGLKRIPGSAFKGILDTTHPLAFGMEEQLYSLKFSTNALTPSTSYQTVGYYHKDENEVLASGYASDENKKNSAGMTFAAVQNMGRGKVVLLTDNTQYRMFWVGPARMMQNAVMQMPSY